MPLKEQLLQLYNKAYDPETRVELVTEYLKAVGADKYLSEKQVSIMANCSTAAGLVEKAQEYGPIYCPKLYKKGTGLYEKTKERYEKYSPAVIEAKDVVASKIALARDAEGRRELFAEVGRRETPQQPLLSALFLLLALLPLSKPPLLPSDSPPRSMLSSPPPQPLRARSWPRRAS